MKAISKLTCLILLAGCQMNQEARQLPDEALVTFVNADSGMTFRVDDSTAVSISGDDTRYSIAAGAHTITVFHDGQVVARQKVYAAPGQTVEVRVR